MNIRPVLFAFFLMTFPHSLLAQKMEISQMLEARGDECFQVAHQIWEWAEVGDQEEKSSDLLQNLPTSEGPLSQKFFLVNGLYH